MNIIEKEFDGVYVKHSGNETIFGFKTEPQKQRCRYILEKELKKGNTEFEITQNPVFDQCGIMIDVSRGGVMKVGAVMQMIDAMVSLGYNALMLYTEDVYELEKYPMFGYMRGPYTLDELRSIDDYAFANGVEVIPCIQTLGHLAHFIQWGSVPRDNGKVLLIGDEKTYEFIEEEISFMSKAFRSRNIHIGMDEAYGMGLGNYLIKNGFQDRMKIFDAHLSRVIEICKKYGYDVPMMWSDMYYSTDNGINYTAPDYIIPQDIVNNAEKDVSHVFWDYYHTDYSFYNQKFEQERRFGNEVIFAGGIWTWDGYVPNFRYSYETMSQALEAAIDNGIKRVFATMWGDYGSETDLMLAVSSLPIFSEYCYLGKQCSINDIYEASEYISGDKAEYTEAVSDYWLGLAGSEKLSTGILYSDLLIDTLCYDYDLSKAVRIYENSLKVIEKYKEAETYSYYKSIFTATLNKCRLLSDIRREYFSENKKYLLEVANKLIPQLCAEYMTFYEELKNRMKQSRKPFGFEKFPVRFGGLCERMRNVAEILKDYAEGRSDKIEELEAKREKLNVSWKEYKFYTRVG